MLSEKDDIDQDILLEDTVQPSDATELGPGSQVVRNVMLNDVLSKIIDPSRPKENCPIADCSQA
jgi:hypothetical protein